MSHWDSRMVPSQCRLSCSKGSALGSGSNRGPSAPPPPPPSSFYPPVVLRLPPPSSLVILNARSSSLGDAPCRGHADAPPSLSLVVVPPPPPSHCCCSSSPATTSDVVPPERYGLHRHDRQQQRPRGTLLLPPDALGGLGRGQCRESVLGGGALGAGTVYFHATLAAVVHSRTRPPWAVPCSEATLLPQNVHAKMMLEVHLPLAQVHVYLR